MTWWLGILCALAGCADEGRENFGIRRSDVATVDVRAIAADGELEKALGLPFADAVRRLGAYRRSASTHLELSAGDKHDTLDETWVALSDGKKGQSLARETSHGEGYEWRLVDGTLFVRPRYGRFVRRRPEGNEVERAFDDAQGALRGYLAPLDRFVTRSDSGEGTIEGRPARRVTLSLNASPSRATDDDEPRHTWRKTISVSALSGEVWVDARSGVPLREELNTTYKSTRDGHPVSVALRYHATVDQLATVGAVQAPADALSAPARPRPLVDRQTLLEGLATGHH